MSGLAPLATPDRRSTKYKWAPRDQALRSHFGTGSLSPIYTKGDTLYSSAIVAMAPRDQALRSQGSLGESERGRSHLFTQKGTLSTLPLSLRWLRGTRRSVRREAWGRKGFRALREGVRWIASNARFGPVPLPLWVPFGCGF